MRTVRKSERSPHVSAAKGTFGNLFYGGTAWSPDGKKIASIAHGIESDRGFQNVVEVPVEGGAERPLTSQRWHQIQRLAWLADGSGLLMTAAEKASDFRAAANMVSLVSRRRSAKNYQ